MRRFWERFVVPAVLQEGHIVSVAPRQRFKPGHLVWAEMQRSSTNELVTFPRGTAICQVLGENSTDTTLLNVRVIRFLGTTYHVGKTFVVSKRSCDLLHPDPEFYGVPQVRTVEGTGEVVPVVDSAGFQRYSDREDVVVIGHPCSRPSGVASILNAAYQSYVATRRNIARNSLTLKLREWSKMDIATRREAMILRCVSGYTDRGHPTVVARLKSWFKGRKDRGTIIAREIAKVRANPCQETFSSFSTVIRGFAENGNLNIVSRAAISDVAARVMLEHGLVRNGACGHFSEGPYRYVSNGYSMEQLHRDYAHDESAQQRIIAERSYCPDCIARLVDSGRMVEALDQQGRAHIVVRSIISVWEWADGTLRMYAEPPVIDGYHTSKEKLAKPLPHITGDDATGLLVGYELEFVRTADAKVNVETVAKRMKARFEAATKGALGTQPYACFERDGSVDFEMVAGYGPLDIHRAAILATFGDGEFAKDVRSHDSSERTCGLHVHLDKPRHSLIHAIKLTQFWNDPRNERLIRVVARRYSAGGYCAVMPGKMKDASEQAKLVRHGKRNSSLRKKVLSAAMTAINSNRYELCNWQNPNTVEIRAFRGTLRATTIIACLEFSVMAWYFSRDTPAHLLDEAHFLEYVSRQEWRHETRYLRKYLHEKGFNVWVPTEAKGKTREFIAELVNEA